MVFGFVVCWVVLGCFWVDAFVELVDWFGFDWVDLGFFCAFWFWLFGLFDLNVLMIVCCCLVMGWVGCFGGFVLHNAWNLGWGVLILGFEVRLLWYKFVWFGFVLLVWLEVDFAW